MKKNGFTLLELIITVIIVAILAGISIPYGTRSFEAAKAKGARIVLQAVNSSEREYCLHNGQYADLNTLVNEGYLENPNDPDQRDWTYSTTFIPSSGPNDCGSFSAEALRNGSGHNAGETISIDQNGVFGGNFTP